MIYPSSHNLGIVDAFSHSPLISPLAAPLMILKATDWKPIPPLLSHKKYSKGHASSMRVCVFISMRKYAGDDPLLLAFIIKGNLHNYLL